MSVTIRQKSLLFQPYPLGGRLLDQIVSFTVRIIPRCLLTAIAFGIVLLFQSRPLPLVETLVILALSLALGLIFTAALDDDLKDLETRILAILRPQLDLAGFEEIRTELSRQITLLLQHAPERFPLGADRVYLTLSLMSGGTRRFRRRAEPPFTAHMSITKADSTHHDLIWERRDITDLMRSLAGRRSYSQLVRSFNSKTANLFDTDIDTWTINAFFNKQDATKDVAIVASKPLSDLSAHESLALADAGLMINPYLADLFPQR